MKKQRDQKRSMISGNQQSNYQSNQQSNYQSNQQAHQMTTKSSNIFQFQNNNPIYEQSSPARQQNIYVQNIQDCQVQQSNHNSMANPDQKNGQSKIEQILCKNTIDLTDSNLRRMEQNQQNEGQYYQPQQKSSQQQQQPIIDNTQQYVDAFQGLNIKKYDIASIRYIYPKKSNFYSCISNKEKKKMEQLMGQVQSFNNIDDSVSSDSQQQSQQQHEPIFKQQKSLKQCTVESAKYLLQLFQIDSPRIIISVILLLILTIIQLNYDVDKRCDLKYLYENRSKKNLNSPCPYNSYIILNLINIIAFYCMYGMSILWILNFYQFSNRIVMHLVSMVVVGIQIFIDTYFQTLGTFSVFTELQIVTSITLSFYMILNDHSIGVQLQRVLQAFFYFLVTALMQILSLQVRDTRNFYSGVILQNITYVAKKISQIYLQYRLKSNLQYDDISLFYIAVVALEYVFIFDQLFIQDRPQIQKLVSVVNFLIIQVQNITNQSIFYLVYCYFKNKGAKVLQKIVLFKYIILVLITISDHLYYFFNGIFVFVAYNAYMKFAEKFLAKNNRKGEIQHLKAIVNNKYFEQKIDESEINHYTRQQSILGFYNFLFYQILLLLVKALFQKNSSVDIQFQLIYYLEKHQNNSLTFFNVLIFNLLTILLIFGLVLIKNKKQVRTVKQATKYIPITTQVIAFLGVTSLMNMMLFQHGYTKQEIKISPLT